MASACAPVGGRRCKCAGAAVCACPLTCCCLAGESERPRALRCPDAGGHMTRCLGCAGAPGAARPYRVLKRPAAPAVAPKARAKAKAGLAQAPAVHMPQVPVVVPPPPPPPCPAPCPAVAAGIPAELYAARTAALLHHAEALDRNSAALVAVAAASRAQGEGAVRVAAAQAVAAVDTAAVAAAPDDAVPVPPEACPPTLQRLRAAVTGALSRPDPPEAADVLRAAGRSPSSAVDWAQLRAVVVVFCPDAASRIEGLDMAERVSPYVSRMCERWCSGNRLRDVVCSFGNQAPATHLNNLTRWLLARPTLRARHYKRLLADSVLLAVLSR